MGDWVKDDLSQYGVLVDESIFFFIAAMKPG